MRWGAALTLTLAACAAEPAPEPTPTATIAAPRTLVAADFDPAALGAKIVGPKGPTPEFAIMAGGEEIARIKSFVACPKAMTACVPAELPEETVLTFVHTITPAAATASLTPKATASSAPVEMPPLVFRMTRPAPGFNGAVGFALAEAEAALGAPNAIAITIDQGQLIWRVTGGTGWKPGAPVTVWWQTTEPPAGPQDAFELELGGETATARGPFPAADKAVERTPAR